MSVSASTRAQRAFHHCRLFHRYFDPGVINPQTIKYELDFLNNIDGRGKQFYDKFFIKNALRRYEHFWIPLVAKCSKNNEDWNDLSVAPPLDVHWVWHVHMLSPVKYRNDLQDCTDLGRSLNHKLVFAPLTPLPLFENVTPLLFFLLGQGNGRI